MDTDESIVYKKIQESKNEGTIPHCVSNPPIDTINRNMDQTPKEHRAPPIDYHPRSQVIGEEGARQVHQIRQGQ
jgi:hypothetical protein